MDDSTLWTASSFLGQFDQGVTGLWGPGGASPLDRDAVHIVAPYRMTASIIVNKTKLKGGSDCQRRRE